jgi:hypothetical protein
MKTWTRRVWVLFPILVLAGSVLVGCSGKEEIPKPKAKPNKGGGTEGGGGGDTAGTMTAIKGKGTGTLKGTVKLTGDLPDFAGLTDKLQAGMQQDRAYCLSGSEAGKSEYVWIVDSASKGVKNVFVWLRPEDDQKQFFDVAEIVKAGKFPKQIEFDQPHCAYLPHATVLFPKYIDPAKPTTNFRKWLPTGQNIVVKNNAKIAHNAKIGGESSRVPEINQTISPGGHLDATKFINPSYKKQIEFACSIHTWMKAYAWAFDHPYAAVTNEKGEFKIENVPTGVKLRVVAWHEVNGFVNGEKGVEIELKDGDNTKDYTLSK